MKTDHNRKHNEHALIDQFLQKGLFIVIGKNRHDPHPDLPFEAWAYQGALDFNMAAPVTFGLGKNIKDCLSSLDHQLKQTKHSGKQMLPKAALAIDPPPRQNDSEPLWRVIYTIDVHAKDSKGAAVSAHQMMTDPDSMAPVLDVMNADGKVTRVDLSEREDNLDEHHAFARNWSCPYCSYSVKCSYEDLAESGSPICPDCDVEMQLE